MFCMHAVIWINNIDNEYALSMQFWTISLQCHLPWALQRNLKQYFEEMIKVHWFTKLNDIGKLVKLGFLMFGESGMIWWMQNVMND